MTTIGLLASINHDVCLLLRSCIALLVFPSLQGSPLHSNPLGLEFAIFSVGQQDSSLTALAELAEPTKGPAKGG